MNIPPKYEDVVAQLETERARVTDYIAQRAQTELLLEATLGSEAALRESLTDKRDEYNKLGDRYDALQQRLTVAEKRVGELRKDAERWRFVRNPLGNRSPFAIWSEKTNLFIGKHADEAIDAAMGKIEKVAEGIADAEEGNLIDLDAVKAKWSAKRADRELEAAAEGEGS